MVDLFNENTLFVFFFAMVAIYNYSALKEYQRMAIIYISVYALAALDIISIKLGLLFLIVALLRHRTATAHGSFLIRADGCGWT
ncbi:hypothetical protein PMN51_16905 [Blautia wexlerae]|nr:hypothetical protein [Blautia wexlerae]